MTIATSMAPTPADRPMPMATSMYRASPVLLSVFRKRTTATMPPRLNARARLLCTRVTRLVTAIGRIMIVSTSDWS